MLAEISRKPSALVDAVIKNCNDPEGYCVVLGAGSKALVTELLVQSKLKLIVVDSDAQAIDAMRKSIVASGLYGSRASAYVADTFDAITSTRTYHTITGRDTAMETIRSGSGIQFDARVVDALERIIAAGEGAGE